MVRHEFGSAQFHFHFRTNQKNGDSHHAITSDSLNDPLDSCYPIHDAYRAFSLRANSEEVHGRKVTLDKNHPPHQRPRSSQERHEYRLVCDQQNVQYADGYVMDVS